ncbi:unnamed protein product [Rotaria sp. Silwood1]|nr:unnamed protein product [Rotaria sp. Silwood1]CAF1682674.1 unnamed protein product [Rotaria sp. Silwood1]CAF3861279.1 unnamed protein product [Rotaria sp. Silwood1]CAF3921560.1 unnamed protein product [Rotaria sp. Silwood1]CAF3939011.1 unnamed protein product [Rotaria sp. Silwood1]
MSVEGDSNVYPYTSTFHPIPKRPVSDDITEMLDDTPRYKDILPPINNEENDQEYLPLTQQIPKMSTFDDDLAEKVEQYFRNEQQTDIDMMEINESNKKIFYMSTIGLANEQPTNIDKKSNKTKSSLANRVKRYFFRPNHNTVSSS